MKFLTMTALALGLLAASGAAHAGPYSPYNPYDGGYGPRGIHSGPFFDDVFAPKD